MNIQKLNPAGYLINDDPMNQNPFFSFDSSDIDPSIDGRLTNIENKLVIIENNINHLLTVTIPDLEARISKNESDILELKNEISGVLTVLEGI